MISFYWTLITEKFGERPCEIFYIQTKSRTQFSHLMCDILLCIIDLLELVYGRHNSIEMMESYIEL